ncbi:MAG: aminoglycoside phosphotransferase family protein [Gemmatimonadales bacterium]
MAALQAAVRAEFARRGQALGLDPDRLRVEYVLNWGGFVNQSFWIGDGEPRFHLKLSTDPDDLATWYRIHRELTANYRAPPVLDWVTIAETSHHGMLFPYLAGGPVERWSPGLRHELALVLRRLHADRAIRARAWPDDGPTTCAAGYFEDFHERFVADLAFVAERAPGFVDASLLAWLHAEVTALAAMVTGSAAFDRPADAMIHGDLWPNNILVQPSGHWYLLDWDECRIGDPALDLAKLFDDGMSEGVPVPAAEIAAAGDPATAERLHVYWRAILLDWVIDPLADYLDADQAPEHAGAVRVRKEREHRLALGRYRAKYRRP